ncbi:hypothetical protein HALLA_17160 [Halostagnicola larsenii XH-48]|uniref:Uncharacterized protein n=1 Tax=Halostagnicola larsenii XH-48 TaxID=797299 RepID=W0JVM5_9EURY|nr:hypothetical protein [Halostagnicola larsenii]AHG01118.1 hypothetical protein HALLA_17160 [Halostagnicola larsenii XH-48]
MTKAMPALLALFLVVSLPAMTVAAATPTATERSVEGSYEPVAIQSVEPVAVQDTTNRLTLTDPARNETIEYGQDLGTILALSDDDLRNEYEWDILFDEEFEDVSDRERDEMINASLENVRDRTDELEQREKDAVRAHADGEISTNQLLQILIRNYNDASALEQRTDEIAERSDDVVGYSMDTDVQSDLQSDQERLTVQQGTVRALAASSEQGTGTTGGLPVQIQTSDAGYRLETMVDDTYVVETTRIDNRDIDGYSEYDDQSQAFDRFEELYPWATEDGTTSFSNDNGDPWNLYRAEIPHSQGILTSFLDSNSGEIFHEVQELNVERLPISETTTETDNGLEVTHNETPADGPVKILVHDTETGEPAEGATISIDGTEVGETNSDGSLWYLPSSDEYEVEAESGGETVTLEIS